MMEGGRGRKRRLRLVTACVVVLGAAAALGELLPSWHLVGAQTGTAPGARENIPFVQINEDGFGDCLNSYAWSMAWFAGKLYVGTNRGSVAQQIADPEFHCQSPEEARAAAAEIWRYTVETATWERVLQSPFDIPIPGQDPPKFTARDHGFRDMIVFTEPDGTDALYVAGVVYPYAFPGAPLRPRILRSTDGLTFEPIPQDPETVLGDLIADSFRAMAVYKGRLYVTAGSVVGEGILLEAADPAGGNNNFRAVNPPGLLAFELAVFNDFLYVGSAEPALFTGFSVLKTNASPTDMPYYDFVPVVSHGAYGRYFLGPNNAVLSMNVFNGRLYVGGQTDLIRLNPDDSWDLVVGDPRQTPEGEKLPISGLPAGFANPFTGHLWRMERHGTSFYVGTWDFAVFLRNWPFIGPIATLEAGFDLWKTRDGVYWAQITRDGFGDKFNHGVRSLVSTPVGLFLGTVNPWEGAQIWLKAPIGQTSYLSSHGRRSSRGRRVGVAGNAATADEPGQTSLAPPARLHAERQHRATVLSWDAPAAAARYHIYRADYWSNQVVGIPQLPSDAWIPGQFSPIGTTTALFFRDSTAQGVRCAYHVRAEGQRGQLSGQSNVAIVPALAPAMTFDRVQTAIGRLPGRGKVRVVGGEIPFARLAAEGRAAAGRSDWPPARSWLEALRRRVVQNPGGALDPLAAEDLEIMVAALGRRVGLAHAGVIPGWSVLTEP